jgi:Skp family chaperone for outer membrane proteins
MSPRIYKAYTSYIDKKLAWSIEHGMTLTPTTGKLIAKREKAHKVNLLTGKLAIEELFKRRQAELDKVRPDGERIVQQYGTILVGDARLRTMTRNLEEERRVDALQAKKAESLRKKREYREGVEKRREEREAKKAEKLAQKQARAAELASLVSRPSRKNASTQ